MNYKLEDLIDIPLLQSLQEKLNIIYSFPSSIIDNNGKVLTAVAWQDICTKFHRTNSECEKECIKSDQYILEHLHEAKPAVSYICPHGLVDNATPIIIDGHHLGNFFTGQFFLEKPNLEFFKKQAKKYGFDKKAYLEAVEKVPIWTKKKLAQYLDFIKGFIEIIAGIGLKQLKEIEYNKIITEAENSIRKSEENLLEAQKTAKIGSWEWDIGLNKVEWSNEMFNVLDINPESYIGNPEAILEVIHPDDIEKFTKSMTINKIDGSSTSLDYRIIHKDGSIHYINARGRFELDAKGKPIKGFGTIQDITERKKVENALIESENKFRTITENSPDAIFLVNNKGNYVYANQSAAKLLGYSIDELLTKNIKDIGEASIEGERFQKLLKERRMFAETYLKKKDGTYVFVDLNALMLPNGILYGSCRDLTERKLANDALFESENKFRLLFQNLNAGFALHEIVKDKDGNACDYRFLEVNPAFEKLTGLKASNIIGKTAFEVLPNIEAYWVEVYGQVVFTGKAISFENYSAELKKYFQVNAYSPNQGQFATIVIDITERKLAEERINLITERLKLSTESAGIGIWDLDLKSNILVWDKRMFELYGIKEEEFGGAYEAWEKGIHPDDMKRSNAEVQEAINGKKEFHTQFRILWPNGQIRFIEAHATVQFDKNGKADRMIGVNWDITKQKLAEEALKESQEIYRKLVEKSLQGIVVAMNNPIRIAFASLPMEKIAGYSPNELERFGPEELTGLIYEDDRESFFKAFADRISGKDVNPRGTYRLNHKDGRVRWIELFSTLIHYKKEAATQTVFVDITEQKEAENALQHSEEKHRSYVENSPLGIFVVDDKGKYIDVNPEACELLGYSQDELIKLSIPDISISKEDNKKFEKLKKEGSLSYEVGLKKKDGSIVNVKLDAARLPNNQFIAYCSDITERIQAEEALQLSEAKYKNLVETASDAIYQISEDGIIIDTNQCACDMLGKSKDEIIGCYIDSVDPNYTVDKFLKLWNNISFHENAIFETTHIRKDGSLIPMEISGKKHKLKDKVFYYGIARDITERKEVENELINAKEKAEESDRLKSAFLANMSHEIRTPMSGILGFTNLLKEPGLSGDEQQQYISIIEKSGARMLNTIHDIIDISKIESGQVDVSLTEINLNTQMEELFDFFSIEAKKKNIKLYYTISQPNQQIIIKSDKEKLNSILTNLIKNAMKYTNSGTIEFGYNLKPGTELPVLSPVTLSGVEVEFYVKDTGIGIPKERQKAIFNRFEQADIEDRQVYEGSGLGLTISKAYVEMLNGKIWLESEVGVGTTFYFTLPFNEDKKEKTGNSPDSHLEEKIEETKELQNKKLKILIAEDEEYADLHLSILLKNIGKEILHSKNGIETVEIFKNNPDIDLILMDIKMPKMNGYEATKQIRSINKDIIIIAQTAHALEGDEEKALEAGCNDYISKPINKEELMEKIGKLVKSH